MKTITFEIIDSTNNYLKKHHEDFNDFTWVIADDQTQGKGRMDKKWIGGTDSLLCSVLLKKDISTKNISLIPLLAAQSLHKVLSRYHGNIKIKWPNDLYLNNQKIAGILTESIIEANNVLAVIIGFGINLNQKEFFNDLKDIATSLYLHTNQTYDKHVILNQIQVQFESDLNLYFVNPLQTISYCNQYNYLKGLTITFNDHHQPNIGEALNINEHGQLVIKTKDGLIALNSGEVSINIKL